MNYLNETNLRDKQKIYNNLMILDNDNYYVDFNGEPKSIYTFSEGSGLITSYSNAPSYINIKNDFHIWGKGNDEYPIHYHMVIKEKPIEFNTYKVFYSEDEFGNTKINIADDGDEFAKTYKPEDWRAELYLQGLTKWKNGIRPDQYEQEIIDNFDSIYDFKEKQFKADLIKYPNGLRYFIDYLEPAEELHNYSVDNLGIKKEVYQQDTLVRMYDVDIPNLILINNALSTGEKNKIIERCKEEGQAYSNINSTIYDNLIIGAAGDSLANGARNLLYQHTNFNESITIQAMPIYYLEPNSRITVNDKASNIYGDYIIDSISLPLDGMGTMTITAKRALERI